MWKAQVDQDYDERQRARREANEADMQEAREYRDNMDKLRGGAQHGDGRGHTCGGRSGAERRKLTQVAEQLAAAQEMAGAQGNEQLHQLLAAIGAQMANIENTTATAEEDDYDDYYGGYDYDDGDDGDEMQEDDGDYGVDSPPWRRSQRRRMQEGGRIEHGHAQRSSGEAATTEGSAGGGGKETAGGDAQQMGWTTPGTERARADKRDAEGQSRSDRSAADEQSQQAREAQRAAEAAMEQARAAQREARRQRGLDKLRGQVQIEKNKEIERRQKEAGCNVVQDAQAWTAEQLDQNAKIVEQINKEYERKAEEKFAAMSEEEVQRLLGDHDADAPDW